MIIFIYSVGLNSVHFTCYRPARAHVPYLALSNY